MYALFTAIPLVGHLNPLLRQAAELQARGWEVAVATFAEMRSHVAAEAPGVAFVDLGASGPFREPWRRAVEAASTDPSFTRGSLRVCAALWDFWLPMFDALAPAVDARKPDVMVVDLFSSAGLAVAEAARVPAVVNNPDLLALLPVTLLPAADHLPFLFSGCSVHDVPWYQRAFTGFLRREFAAAVTSLVADRTLNRLRQARGLPPTTVHALLADRRLLVNGAFGLEYPRAVPPLVSMVGPMLPRSIPELPPEVATWLGDGPPVVYVNLGTLAVPTTEQLARLTRALDSPRFRSLWILRDEHASRLPSVRPSTLRAMDWALRPPRSSRTRTSASS